MLRNAPKLPPPSRLKAISPIKHATSTLPPTSIPVPSKRHPGNQCITVIERHVSCLGFHYEDNRVSCLRNPRSFSPLFLSLGKRRVSEAEHDICNPFISPSSIPRSIALLFVFYSPLITITNIVLNRLHQHVSPQIRPGC
jgi:hypothetical protein